VHHYQSIVFFCIRAAVVVVMAAAPPHKKDRVRGDKNRIAWEDKQVCGNCHGKRPFIKVPEAQSLGELCNMG
jgi:hypothetical protein